MNPRQSVPPAWWKRYTLAIVLVALAAALRIWPLESLESRLVWLTFYPTVMIVAIYGGIYAGLLATALACLIVTFLWQILVAHPFIKDAADGLGMAVFILNGAMISGVAEALRRAQTRVIETLNQIAAANARLRQKELSLTQYAAIIESSDDAIISKTLEGIITSWNGGAERMFGYTREEAQGRPVSFLIPEQCMNDEMLLLEQVRAGVFVKNYETMRRCKEGKLINVSITLSPIRDYEGNIVGTSKIMRDITERKEIERVKSEFISMVIHELRTPITSIKGSLNLIESAFYRDLPEKVSQLISIASKNCERIVLLINDILDMDKIAAGEMRLEMKPENLAVMVKQGIETNASYGDKFKIRFITDPVPPHIDVNVDAGRWQQIFSNLLSNAAKFSPEGSDVRVFTTEKDGYVRVSVQDKGPGIPDNFRSKIFERFTQADSAAMRKIGGTGLGLHISKQLVKKMNGEIGFDTTPGAGSVFWFEFPVFSG